MKYQDPVYVDCLRAAASPTAAVIHDAPAAADTPAAVIGRIRKGLPMAEFRALADWLGVSDDQLAPLLGISRATLHRRRKTGHLESGAPSDWHDEKPAYGLVWSSPPAALYRWRQRSNG